MLNILYICINSVKIVMVILLLFLEILFYLIFFILKLYSLLDKKYILSSFGTKLEKYIKKQNLKNIDSNFEDEHKNNFFLIDFFLKLKSPKIRKRYFVSFAVSLSILFLRISINYKILNSNTYIISFFSKNIDLFLILNQRKNIYIFTFYMLFFLTILIFLKNIIILYENYKEKIKKTNDLDKNYENATSIDIGNIYYSNKSVSILNNGIYQNILVTGSIGSGKTSSVISNILKSMLKNNINGIVIDVKGSYYFDVIKIAKLQGKSDTVKIISLDKNMYNPFNKLKFNAVEIAHDVRKVIENMAINNISDPFWLDKAEEYIKCFLIILKYLNEKITFLTIHLLVTDINILSQKVLNVKEKIKKEIENKGYNVGDEINKFEVIQAINTIENEYMKLDERTIGIIKAEITRITGPFSTNLELENQFNKATPLEFNTSKIYVFSVNIFENRKIAKILSTFFKLDFQKYVMSRKNIEDIFCVCDEYQEVANKEDAYFVSLSREFKCINVFCMQSYSSLMLALNDENATKVIIQNLVNKVWLRNDDVYTVTEIIKQIGNKDVERKSFNVSEMGQNSKYNMLSNKMINFKSGLSKSISYSSKKESYFTQEYFTYELKNFEAVAMISNGNEVKLYDKVKLKRWDEL